MLVIPFSQEGGLHQQVRQVVQRLLGLHRGLPAGLLFLAL